MTALRLQHITHDTLTTAHLFDYASTLGAQAVLGSVIFEPQSVATGAVCVHSVDRVGGIVRLEVIVFPPSGQSRRLSSSKPALLTLDVIPGVPCADLVRVARRRRVVRLHTWVHFVYTAAARRPRRWWRRTPSLA